MKNNYCLPIIKKTEAEVLSEIKANELNYGFFEIWLDYIEDLRGEFLLILLREYKYRLVFVFRRKNLEKPRLNLEEQKNILKLLAERDCLVDLDVYDQERLIQSAKNNKLKTIISYHNYKETPSEDKLDRILDDIKASGPEVIKISVFCNSNSDALLLLKIMLELNAGKKKHIILGMGEKGKITRLYGALWGNELTFITENEKDSSAPGQLTRAEFENMLEDWKIR